MADKSRETEIVTYARITKLDGLEKAISKEHIMQAEIFPEPTNSKGLIRVRKSEINGVVTCVETIKTRVVIDGNISKSSEEHNNSITSEWFDTFFNISSIRYDKTRYCFVSKDIRLDTPEVEEQTIILPSITYEIDVFKKAYGNISQFCKIDVELDQVLAYLKKNHPNVKSIDMSLGINHLPLGLTDIYVDDRSVDISSQNIQYKDECYKEWQY